MAFNRTQVNNISNALDRALTLDSKANLVEAAAKIIVDENDDLAVTNPAQVAAYVANKRALRDTIIATVKPIVAGWDG